MALDADILPLLLDTVRRFVNDRLIPAEEEVAANNAIPAALLSEMGEIGLYGLSLPAEFGGLALNMEEEASVVFELGRASPAFRSAVGTNIGIGSQSIVIAGTDEQRQKYLPKMATGEIVGCFALTEPDAGSDALSLSTRADKDGDGYILNGTKRFITNAPTAGLVSVMARTSPERSSGSISCFLVEKGTPGLILGAPDKKMGQAGALTCDVILDNCRVPESALLGGMEGIGFKTAMKVLDKGRLHVAALCVGMADRLIEESVSYALERRQFGKPLSDFQLVQAMIADSKMETYAARCMVLDAARKRDANRNTTLEASCCKLFASEMVGRVADRAVQIHGGAGYMSDYAVERFFRDARLFRLYEGTSQIQQIIIAREVLNAVR